METDEDSGGIVSMASLLDRFLGKRTYDDKKGSKIFPSKIE